MDRASSTNVLYSRTGGLLSRMRQARSFGSFRPLDLQFATNDIGGKIPVYFSIEWRHHRDRPGATARSVRLR